MPPAAIRYVTDAQGKLLEEHVPEGREALSPEMAYVVTHMLRGVVERGTGQGAKILGRPIAAKTGTTNDYSNAWFIGFTPHVATGVWVGYDRPRSLGRDETGSRVAVPIWTAYMAKVLGDRAREDFPVPERVSLVPVDLDPSNECVRVVTMAFVRGTEPVVACGARRQAVTPAAVPQAGVSAPPLPTAPLPAPAPPSAGGVVAPAPTTGQSSSPTNQRHLAGRDTASLPTTAGLAGSLAVTRRPTGQPQAP